MNVITVFFSSGSYTVTMHVLPLSLVDFFDLTRPNTTKGCLFGKKRQARSIEEGLSCLLKDGGSFVLMSHDPGAGKNLVLDIALKKSCIERVDVDFSWKNETFAETCRRGDVCRFLRPDSAPAKRCFVFDEILLTDRNRSYRLLLKEAIGSKELCVFMTTGRSVPRFLKKRRSVCLESIGDRALARYLSRSAILFGRKISSTASKRLARFAAGNVRYALKLLHCTLWMPSTRSDGVRTSYVAEKAYEKCFQDSFRTCESFSGTVASDPSRWYDIALDHPHSVCSRLWKEGPRDVEPVEEWNEWFSLCDAMNPSIGGVYSVTGLLAMRIAAKRSLPLDRRDGRFPKKTPGRGNFGATGHLHRNVRSVRFSGFGIEGESGRCERGRWNVRRKSDMPVYGRTSEPYGTSDDELREDEHGGSSLDRT